VRVREPGAGHTRRGRPDRSRFPDDKHRARSLRSGTPASIRRVVAPGPRDPGVNGLRGDVCPSPGSVGLAPRMLRQQSRVEFLKRFRCLHVAPAPHCLSSPER
jgi:hypothetical protein